MRHRVRWIITAVAIWALGSITGLAASFAPDYSPPPGALNPAVTQYNIAQTICVHGWARTVRPPRTYTSALKRRQMAERHLPGVPGDYQEDHYVPLEIGGHPTDPRNLWPQRIREAQQKDQLEIALNHAVCGGRLTLAQAQQCLMRDGWIACARRMHTPAP